MTVKEKSLGTSLFEGVFRAHRPAVDRYVRRRVREDVDDLVEEVFLTAWRKRDDLPQSVEDQLVWLYATARRVIANKLRWRARLDRFNAASIPLTSGSNAQNGSVNESVHAALARMRPADREVLLLVEWDGLSVDATASVLGISPSATNKRLQAARESFTIHFSALEGVHRG